MDRSLLTTLLAFSFTLLLVYLIYFILSPFLATLVWAGAIGIITWPLYGKLLKRCKEREVLASALMTIAVVLAVFLPLSGLALTLSREAAMLYQSLEGATAAGSVASLRDILHHPVLIPWLEKLKPLTSSLNMDLDAMLLPTLKKGLATLLDYSTGVVKNFFTFLFKLGLMVITLFFIYKDGARFLQRFWLIVAIRDGLRSALEDTVARVLTAVMYGIVLTCMVQGMLGGLGFWVAGLPSPVLFGALMTICAVIPIVGTALVWLPGALYLFTHGETLHAVLLIAWGAAVVSGIDNIIRPLFISGRAKLHLMVIMLGVIGGILAFGVTGVVAGPVILALVLVFFDPSRTDTFQKEV